MKEIADQIKNNVFKKRDFNSIKIILLSSKIWLSKDELKFNNHTSWEGIEFEIFPGRSTSSF